MKKQGIYVTSKVKYASSWKEYRDQGYPIISTWIDYEGSNEPNDLRDLWNNLLSECASCAVLVANIEGEDKLKGGLFEIGAALASGARVLFVGNLPEEIKTAKYHSKFVIMNDVKEAMDLALTICKVKIK